MNEQDRAMLARIERKLDVLIVALADDGELDEEPDLDLDGGPTGRERCQFDEL